MAIITDSSLGYLRQLDKLMDMIICKYGPPPNWSRPEGYETLVKIILEQQVSLSAAQATFLKLHKHVESVTPENLIKESISSLREVSVSRQKASYIIGLGHDIVEGKVNLNSLPHMEKKAQLQVLTSIKGIGPWTAEVYQLFALQDTDIYPRGDIALINTIKELYGAADAQEAERISEQWRPHRSTASYLLWHYYLRKRGRENIIDI